MNSKKIKRIRKQMREKELDPSSAAGKQFLKELKKMLCKGMVKNG